MKRIIVVGALMGSGCFTMANLRSAEVLKPGGMEANIAGVVGPGGDVLPAMDAYVGILPRLQVGLRYDVLSLAADARVQLLDAETHGVDLSLEAGTGTGFLLPAPFYYFGVCVSKRLDYIVPYVHVRYMRPEIEMGDEEGAFAEELYAYLAEGFNTAWQIFVGAELAVGGGSSGLVLVGELVWIPTLRNADDEPYVGYNVGVRLRFGGIDLAPAPPRQEVAPVAPYE